VARGFTGDIPHLSQLIQEGIRNKGFSFIDILQPCVSFNRVNTFQWYNSRVYRIEEEEGYDASERMSAFQKAQEWGERIPIGVLYRSARPTREEQEPVIRTCSLVHQPVEPTSFPKLLEAFR
jgi:2-oxoglutarate ferredoxin oxidoreductase subunit beta